MGGAEAESRPCEPEGGRPQPCDKQTMRLDALAVVDIFCIRGSQSENDGRVRTCGPNELQRNGDDEGSWLKVVGIPPTWNEWLSRSVALAGVVSESRRDDGNHSSVLLPKYLCVTAYEVS